MSIRGRTLREAAQTFCDHANRVLNRTVTRARLVVIDVPPRVQVAFRQAGRPFKARLQTRFGRMGLYLGQVCDFVLGQDGLLMLRTIEYKYTLTLAGDDEPLLRWEYVKHPPPGAEWCRHHLQGPVDLEIHDPPVPLDDLHLPTGYVTFEEVLRFCIVDLGVPPLHDEWDAILVDSYRKFRAEFVQ